MIKNILHRLKQRYINECLDQLTTVTRYEMTFQMIDGEVVEFKHDFFTTPLTCNFDDYMITCHQSIGFDDKTYYTKFISSSTSKAVESYIVRPDTRWHCWWTKDEIEKNRLENKSFLDKYETLYKERMEV